ncbi:MAG: ATP-binding protein [Campylobacterales bacterium]|nr:ATP-binding protein [Campylobacterales bacterium]
MAFIVGPAVRGDNFWDRDDEVEEIWEQLDNNTHILISAPRRVGKTSIMYKVFDEPKENYIPIYINTESADNENEFWQKLFNHLEEEEFIDSIKSTSKTFLEKIKNIKIKKVSLSGVEFGDGKLLNYKDAFIRLIKDLDSSHKIVIMIDEFAQTIENIIKYEGEKSALSLLKTHHEIRQDLKLSEKTLFIYTGSIGLESVVKRISGSKHINDLGNIKVPPLTKDEAKDFIKKICDLNYFNLEESHIDFLIEKIEWLIPFYIQLILQETKKLCKKNPTINESLIEEAIERSIEHRNYFDSWQIKLREGLENEAYLFAKEVLNYTSNNIKIEKKEISNLADKHKIENDESKEIIHSLEYDGYITYIEQERSYRFNSPILRMWWSKNVAN